MTKVKAPTGKRRTRGRKKRHLTPGTVGARIAEAREARGLSRSELAEKVQVHESVVWRWELESMPPKFAKMQQLARELRVPVMRLFGEDKPAVAS